MFIGFKTHTHTYTQVTPGNRKESRYFFESDLYEEVHTVHHFAALFCGVT